MKAARTFLLSCVAALAAAAGLGVLPAQATGEVGPALRPPIEALSVNAKSRHGLNLDLPPSAMIPAGSSQSGTAETLAPDDPSTEENAGLRAYVDVERTGVPFAPMAGIVYGF